MESDIAIVGGGVLGVKTAYWFSELYDFSVTQIDKEEEAQHATLRNTGFVHRPSCLDPAATANATKIFRGEISYASSAAECFKEADCCIAVTEWPEFGKLRPKDFASRTRNPPPDRRKADL